MDVFRVDGYPGNESPSGPAARIVIADIGLESAGIDFDSEAGIFVALASSRAALVTLGRHLALLVQNTSVLRKLIREVPDDEWDD